MYLHRINRVNLSRDLTLPSHLLLNDTFINDVRGVLMEIKEFSTGSPFFKRTLTQLDSVLQTLLAVVQ